MAQKIHVRDENRGGNIKDYWPLIALVGVSALAAIAVCAGFSSFTMKSLMHVYMGVFLIVFALLKLFDPNGFQDGFAMYDLLGMRFAPYGYIYPYLELVLGLAFLSFLAPVTTYLATIILFTFGAAGVIAALQKGLDINCPCMGNILNVPLSTVTLTEDLVMIAMAFFLLFT
ncbi:MauE/DoxX family redox-associated membrane protein [Kordiimonas pumila]|uniref:Methylamine utilization protein MauE n=1 Tax=Kordiimonas pumila TaxID=2161677 RepID=A0ABV7D1V7_9PROT|nr:MauE/DoxX family redox-associated membrane protein [Kordiimonas pumila]